MIVLHVLLTGNKLAGLREPHRIVLDPRCVDRRTDSVHCAGLRKKPPKTCSQGVKRVVLGRGNIFVENSAESIFRISGFGAEDHTDAEDRLYEELGRKYQSERCSRVFTLCRILYEDIPSAEDDTLDSLARVRVVLSAETRDPED
jgi:hypothetical protein